MFIDMQVDDKSIGHVPCESSSFKWSELVLEKINEYFTGK